MTRKKTRRKSIRAIHPVTRALIARDWRSAKLTAEIHALMGGDSDKMVNGAGRIFYVVLGACAEQDFSADHADVRIIRGAVEALHDQAGEQVIDDMRRSSVNSGLAACNRVLGELEPRCVNNSAVELAQLLVRGDVHHSDFLALFGTATV